MCDEVEKDDEDKKSENADVRNRRLRALILGTIAAGGAFQINGWQAQAHGNRSSGAMESIRAAVTPDDLQVQGKPAEEPKPVEKAKPVEKNKPLDENRKEPEQ